jgi:hypothetical protein
MTINISTRCYTPIKGLMARVIKLDDCGVPVTGASSGQIVFKGFTKVTGTAQYENGDRQLVRLADGSMCLNEKDPDLLTNFELAIDLCTIDPGLVANTISPARLLTATESPTGTGFAMAEGSATSHWSLEVWQKVAGVNRCISGVTRYVYNAWPHLTDGKLGGDYSIGVEASSLSIGANSLPVSPNWTAGNSWLGASAVSVVPDHWFQNLTTVAPPSELCGIQSYP